MEKLRLDDIETAGLQVRDLNDRIVGEYADWLRENPKKDFPPVEVCFDGDNYYLWEGHHRLAAYRKVKRGLIPVNTTKGTRMDALTKALGANEQHGLRRTPADRRRAIELAMLIPDIQGDKDKVAAVCHVSRSLVYQYLREKGDSDEQPARKTKLELAREALLDPDNEGMTVEEVAEKCGCSRSTVGQVAKELKDNKGKKPDKKEPDFNLRASRENIEKSVGAASRAVDDHFYGLGATGSEAHNEVVDLFQDILELTLGMKKPDNKEPVLEPTMAPTMDPSIEPSVEELEEEDDELDEFEFDDEDDEEDWEEEDEEDEEWDEEWDEEEETESDAYADL